MWRRCMDAGGQREHDRDQLQVSSRTGEGDFFKESLLENYEFNYIARMFICQVLHSQCTIHQSVWSSHWVSV